MLRRAMSSSCKNAMSHCSVTCGLICGGCVKSAERASMTGSMDASRNRQLVVEQQIRQHGIQVAQQRQPRTRKVDFAQIELCANDVRAESGRLHDRAPMRIDDARRSGHAFSAFEARQAGI